MKKLIVIFLVINIFTFSGCYTLRKKFVRKKKHKKEPVVYVDFKEYPQVPSKEMYQNYYIFAQGWLDELIKSLGYSGNKKKQKQAISEALTNIEQLLGFLNQEGKNKLLPLYRELEEIKDRLYSYPLNEIEKDNLVKRLEYLQREFKREFSWENVSGWVN